MIPLATPVAAWKPLAALLAVGLLLAAGFGTGYHFGGLEAEKALAQAKEGFVADSLNDVHKQLELQAQGQALLEKQLATVPKGDKIREIVKANPSGCVLPPAVASGLREQAAEANRSRSGP